MRSAVIKIERATVAYLKAEAGDLFQAAWDEVEGEGNLEPDWSQYFGLEDAGLLLAWGAWVDDKLVGYSVIGMLPALNTRELLGELLSIFVHPEHRGTGIGARMIRLTHREAFGKGAKMRWRTKRGHRLDFLLRHMGYEEQNEVVYMKGGE